VYVEWEERESESWVISEAWPPRLTVTWVEVVGRLEALWTRTLMIDGIINLWRRN